MTPGQNFRRWSVDNASSTSTCTFINAEKRRIKERHRTVAATVCSKDFCQAGRAIHTNEPRVGENRSLGVVCQEAKDFLRDIYNANHFSKETASEARRQEVHAEVLYGAIVGIERRDNTPTRPGGIGHRHPTNSRLAFGERGGMHESASQGIIQKSLSHAILYQ